MVLQVSRQLPKGERSLSNPLVINTRESGEVSRASCEVELSEGYRLKMIDLKRMFPKMSEGPIA